MDLKDLVRLAQIRDRHDGLPLSPNTRRTLEGYCRLVVMHLQEAMNAERIGTPSKYTGREDIKALTGRGDRSGEDVEDYVPTPGDPVGWSSHVAEAVVVLASLCRAHRLPLDTLLERRLGKYDKKKGKKK